MSLKYHNLMRDAEGWTWLAGSYDTKAAANDAVERNNRSYPERAYKLVEFPTYNDARAFVRRLNTKKKGHPIHPDQKAELELAKKREGSSP
jgi:hypothetical protein